LPGKCCPCTSDSGKPSGARHRGRATRCGRTRRCTDRADRADTALRPARERDTGGAPYWELSQRELAVLRLLESTLSQREIAGELYVSFNTVKTHTRTIFRKLGAASRAEAVARARELGLL